MSPIIFETMAPAARSRIGGRGLYVTGLAQLRSGDLLASPHVGSPEVQRVTIWRSADAGLTWSEVATSGAELYGAGATLYALRDGSVLLHTGQLHRSGDGGVTWRHVACPPTGLVRGFVESDDGRIQVFASDHCWYTGDEPPPRMLAGVMPDWYREGALGTTALRRAWRVHSDDGGQCWSQPEAIHDEGAYITPDTDWSAVQPIFREASPVRLGAGHLLAAARRSEPQRTVLIESTDGGAHWSDSREFLQSGEIQGHLLALGDGRLLCTYARHEVPRGIFAVVSDDAGRTWHLDHPIYLAGSLAGFFGWPTSIALADGTIVTSYTIKAYEESTQENDSVTEVVRWSLPDGHVAEIAPAAHPVFAEPHDYTNYPSGVTGFTGRSLQQVAYWSEVPAQRFQTPGYKGVLSRFPDGPILACVAVPVGTQAYRTEIYRSTDDGESWHQLPVQGEAIPGKEQAMQCLMDGTTVLLQTEASEDVYCRSADAGVTWQRLEYGHHMRTTRNFVELPDGSVLKFGCTGTREHRSDGPGPTAWRLRSTDRGLSWQRDEVPQWDSSCRMFGEVFVLPLSDRLLAATRVSGQVARALAGAPPIGVGAGAGGETDEGMLLMDSHDGGLTWEKPRWFLEYSGVHAHLLKLAGGRILCAYRRRFLPYGVGAVVSNDDGVTWDTDHPIIVGVRPTCYGGWPTTVELPKGDLLTGRGYMTWPDAVFEIVRWRMPEQVGLRTVGGSAAVSLEGNHDG